MKRETIIVERMGMLYRTTRRAFLRWARAIGAGEDVEIPGRLIGPIHRVVTDWNAEEARAYAEHNDPKEGV